MNASPPVGKPTNEPAKAATTVSAIVVVPCLDEERTIGRVVNEIPRHIDGVDNVAVVVIDDGSTDRTAEVARQAGAEVVVHDVNRGLGATFRDAVQIALERRADLMIHIDGDGQFDPADIPTLVRPIVDDRAEMVTASRFLDRELVPDMPRVKIWGNRRIASIVRLLTGHRFADVSCGFRVFSREALLRMNLFGSFTYTQESFLDLIFKNMRILEVPVHVRGVREFGRSRMASNVVSYALRSLKIMMRAFIAYRPFRLFLGIAMLCGIPGVALLAFLGWHYLETGAFSPHIWAGFVGGSSCFLGFTTLVTGVIGDMLVRVRLNQEDILYQLRRDRIERDSG